ncbi:MAG: 3-hydroxyacyl-ACP dehydratase FabZ family protein [Pirellulaceae bacterium]
MRFSQLDRITELVPGERLVAVKSLTLAEEYLQDHFPRFPVMPGVLMMEAMFQASMWLVHATDGFTRSTVVLKEAKQVKFNDFVEPGSQLRVTSTWTKTDNQLVMLQTQGEIDDRIAVRARLTLDHFNQADRGLAAESVDDYLIQERLKIFRRLQDARNLYNSQFAITNDPNRNGDHRVTT